MNKKTLWVMVVILVPMLRIGIKGVGNKIEKQYKETQKNILEQYDSIYGYETYYYQDQKVGHMKYRPAYGVDVLKSDTILALLCEKDLGHNDAISTALTIDDRVALIMEDSIAKWSSATGKLADLSDAVMRSAYRLMPQITSYKNHIQVSDLENAKHPAPTELVLYVRTGDQKLYRPVIDPDQKTTQEEKDFVESYNELLDEIQEVEAEA